MGIGEYIRDLIAREASRHEQLMHQVLSVSGILHTIHLSTLLCRKPAGLMKTIATLMKVCCIILFVSDADPPRND